MEQVKLLNLLRLPSHATVQSMSELQASAKQKSIKCNIGGMMGFSAISLPVISLTDVDTLQGLTRQSTAHSGRNNHRSVSSIRCYSH